jgi:hypothetical protein
VQRLKFSKTKYPNIYAHFVRAIAKGWPRVMVINRKGTEKRRDRLLALLPTSRGLTATSIQPPSVGRGKANGTARGLVREPDRLAR